MNKINAADAIRASIRQYKQLSDYADALEKVGSIEQAEQEALAAANKARAEAEKFKEQANKANQALAQLQETTQLKLIENEQLEKEWIEKAQADVLLVKNNAKASAAKALEEADIKAKAIVKGAHDELARINGILAMANEACDLAVKAKAEAELELAAINEKIAQAKQKIAAIFNKD